MFLSSPQSMSGGVRSLPWDLTLQPLIYLPRVLPSLYRQFRHAACSILKAPWYWTQRFPIRRMFSDPASKVRCGPATKLQPRLPSHGPHCQPRSIRVTVLFVLLGQFHPVLPLTPLNRDPGGGGGGGGGLASPTRPTHPPTHIRKIFLRQNMKSGKSDARIFAFHLVSCGPALPVLVSKRHICSYHP